MPTPGAIIYNALVDIGIIGEDEPSLPADKEPIGISHLNRLLTSWNAKGSLGAYEYTQVFTLPASPSNSPNGYTIGATADSPKLVVTAGRAPLRIDSAKRVVSGVETAIKVLAFQEYDAINIPGLAYELTQAVYLQTIPKLPVLWCYGFASGEQLRLSWKSLFNVVTIADLSTNVDLQDSAEDAITATLSERLCLPFRLPISEDLKDRAREARATLRALNNLPPIAYPDCMESEYISPNRASFLSRNV